MGDRIQLLLFAVLGALAAGGIPALIDRFLTRQWPTWVALFIAMVIGWAYSAASLEAGKKTGRRYMTIAFVVWMALFGIFAFALWERHLLRGPLWFGAAWGLLVAATGEFGNRQEERWKKDLGMRTCPQCGKLLQYAGAAYTGSTEVVSLAGYGTRTRTAQYASAYRCPKCGYTQQG